MLSPDWLLAVVSLPTAQTAARMRLWRALKLAGAATLRDGVYLLPATEATAEALALQIDEVRAAGGEGWVVRAEPVEQDASRTWMQLFDRTDDYRQLIDEVRASDPAAWPGGQGQRKLQSLWRRHAAIVHTDHFPGEGQRQSAAALQALQAAWLRLTSPDEPSGSLESTTERLDPNDFQGRTWATRRRPWVDRLGSAWLIRRYIDPAARFEWLAAPGDCRPEWLGFDFDGARFTHVGAKVTFETLLAAFGLEHDPALVRIGELVHCLDAGGLPVAQAPGIEAALSGLRDHLTDDDQLLDAACAVFDGLYRALGPKTAETS